MGEGQHDIDDSPNDFLFDKLFTTRSIKMTKRLKITEYTHTWRI